MTSGACLLLVVGEPFSLDQKELISQQIAKGLKSLDNAIAGCNVNSEFERIAAEGLPGEEGANGERVIRSTSENLSSDILINPQLWTVQAHLRDFLVSGAKHRHLIYSGQVLQGCGSWILQDDVFSFAALARVLKEADVENSLKQQESSSLYVHAFGEGNWNVSNLQKMVPKSVAVEFNPAEKLDEQQGLINLSSYLGNKIVVKTPKDLLLSSDVVGNIRFNRPTLYVFPGCNGDSALFGINGFNLLVNGGYNRKACFWDFTRHLDRIDAMLITHLGPDNIFGVSSVMDRKVTENVHPEIGFVYMNGVEKKKNSPNGDTHPENGGLLKQASLVVNLAEEGHRVIENLHLLGQAPGSCIGSMQGKEFKPVNLYHKVGHGTLDMYVLNPMQDSKEMKEFYTQWNKNVNSFSSKGGISLPNMMSVCALLVWRPANVNEKITRILFPGNAPQSKIFEGLDKLKALDIFQHSACSELSLRAPKQPIKKAAGAKPASAPIKRTPPPPIPKAEPKKASSPPPEKKPLPKSAPPSKMTKDARNKKTGTVSKAAKKPTPSASPSSVEAKSPVEPAKPIVPAVAVVVAAPIPDDIPEIKSDVSKEEDKPSEQPAEPVPAWEPVQKVEQPPVESAPVSEEPPQLVDIPPVANIPDVVQNEPPAAAAAVAESSPKEEEPAALPSPVEVAPRDAVLADVSPPPTEQSEKAEADQEIPDQIEAPESLPEPVREPVVEPEPSPEPVKVVEPAIYPKPASPVSEEPPVVDAAPAVSPETEMAPLSPEPEAAAPPHEEESAEADQMLRHVADDPPMGVPEPLPDPGQFDSATYAAFSHDRPLQDIAIDPPVQPTPDEPAKEQDDEPEAEQDISPSSDFTSEVMEELAPKEVAQEALEPAPVSPEVPAEQPLVDTAEAESVEVPERQPSPAEDSLSHPDSVLCDFAPAAELRAEEPQSAAQVDLSKETDMEPNWPEDDIEHNMNAEETEKVEIAESKFEEESMEKQQRSESPEQPIASPAEDVRPGVATPEDAQFYADDGLSGTDRPVEADVSASSTSTEREMGQADEKSESPTSETKSLDSRVDTPPAETWAETSPAEEDAQLSDQRLSSARDSPMSDEQPEFDAGEMPEKPKTPPAEENSPVLPVADWSNDAFDKSESEPGFLVEEGRVPQIPPVDQRLTSAHDSPVSEEQPEFDAGEMPEKPKTPPAEENSPVLPVADWRNDAFDKSESEPGFLVEEGQVSQIPPVDQRLNSAHDSPVPEEQPEFDAGEMPEKPKTPPAEEKSPVLPVADWSNDAVDKSEPEPGFLVEEGQVPQIPPVEVTADTNEAQPDDNANIKAHEPEMDVQQARDDDRAAVEQTGTAAEPAEEPASAQKDGGLHAEDASASEELPKATFESEPLDLDQEGDLDEVDSLVEAAPLERAGFAVATGRPDLLTGISGDPAPFQMDASQDLPPLDCGSTTNPFFGVSESLDDPIDIPQSNGHYDVGPGQGSSLIEKDGEASLPPDLDRDSLEREETGASFDPLKDWGQPMGLPAPDDGNPKNTKKPEAGAVNGAKKPATSRAGARGSASAASPRKPPADGKKAGDAAKKPPAPRMASTPRRPPAPKAAKEEPAKKPPSGTATRRPPSGGRPSSGPAAASQAGPKAAASRGPTAKRASLGSARGAATPKAAATKPVTPFYLDLTYIPNHGDTSYVDVDFFRRIRARYYVLSALSPNPAILNSFLEAKETWEDADAEVTIIPTYDTEVLRHWMALHREKLGQLKVDVAPSASRCTIQLQDHETSCAAYRLEF